MTVLLVWSGRQANPKRGAKLFQSVSYGEVGQPLRPRNLTTPDVPDTGLIWPGAKPFIRLLTSRIGVSVSQRTPKLNVRRSLTVHSSWANPLTYQLPRSSS